MSEPFDKIYRRYEQLCDITGDINEHLPTLKMLAENCDSVFETGVRGCISSWAFCVGLLSPLNHSYLRKKSLFMNDIQECNIQELMYYVNQVNGSQPNKIDASYVWCNNLELDFKRNYDLTFIDTWHVYGQLKRELEKFAPITNKYIVLHDTTIDGELGETIRNQWNANKQSLETGIPVNEINRGLQPAVDEFLQKNSEWRLKVKYNNNNGLTVIERHPHIPYPPLNVLS